MSREAKILSAILVVVVGAMIGLFMLTNSGDTPAATTENIDTSKLVRENSHKQGTGKVTVVEFGDYQCPSCGQAHPVTKQLKEEYGDKITFVFRHFPLPMHQNAEAAAQTAEAAAAQGKFWEMNDKLFTTQSEWSDLGNPLDVFTRYASELGLDADRLRTEVEAKQYRDIIAADKADGTDLQVAGTPTFFVDGQQASRFDYNTLKGMIEDALKKNSGQ